MYSNTNCVIKEVLFYTAVGLRDVIVFNIQNK